MARVLRESQAESMGEGVGALPVAGRRRSPVGKGRRAHSPRGAGRSVAGREGLMEGQEEVGY